MILLTFGVRASYQKYQGFRWSCWFHKTSPQFFLDIFCLWWKIYRLDDDVISQCQNKVLLEIMEVEFLLIFEGRRLFRLGLVWIGIIKPITILILERRILVLWVNGEKLRNKMTLVYISRNRDVINFFSKVIFILLCFIDLFFHGTLQYCIMVSFYNTILNFSCIFMAY